MSELKPCPFCVGDAEEDASSFVEYHGHEHQDSTIKCTSCGIEMTVYAHDITSDFPCSCCHDIPAEARKRWNRRAPVSTPQQSAQRASVDTLSAIADSIECDGLVRTAAKLREEIAHINAWGSAGSGAIPDLYTCKGKGGKYAFLGVAKGAGNAKLIINLAVYRDVASGQLYFRDPTEFDSRMEKIAAPSPAPQGEQAL